MQRRSPEVCKPVLNQMQALKLFVASELAMQSVLVSPGDPSKSTSAALENLASSKSSASDTSAQVSAGLHTCWKISPSLAAALVLRYPAEREAHAALGILAVTHAADSATRAWPQGALRYAEACCSKVCSKARFEDLLTLNARATHGCLSILS